MRMVIGPAKAHPVEASVWVMRASVGEQACEARRARGCLVRGLSYVLEDLLYRREVGVVAWAKGGQCCNKLRGAREDCCNLG
ncbi:unnamed protein product [Dovyalis caffra]|uniref:Uncharacterized protein n=1 Tax=Dovyalis caffra TaxID=77055 RepID=A0AAV1SJY7_9ROSI|nr:unnamed protein product [Dovyalis caffra]